MKNFFLRLFSSLIITPIFIYLLYERSYFFYSLIFFLLIFSFYEIYKNVKQLKISFLLYFLILLFSYSLFDIRGDSYESFIYCIWVLLIVWISDIAGYIVGKLLKGPKLSIYSPNKTISGFFGSVFFSQLSFLLPFYLLSNFSITTSIILIQFLLCLISIFGDIFFSYVKRINHIKDYSNIIPGHGGILDRIDGMIFVIIFYYFIKYFDVV